MKVNNNLNILSNRRQEQIEENSGLSVNDFLQIMAAELKNQNPLGDGEGGSKTDYISQLAQFTTLEHLGNIGDNLEALSYIGQQGYAFNLIGKEVTIKEDGETITGIVDRARIVDGFGKIEVDGKEYSLNLLVEVANKPEEVKEPEKPEE